jgi:hypothetical protein
MSFYQILLELKVPLLQLGNVELSRDEGTTVGDSALNITLRVAMPSRQKQRGWQWRQWSSVACLRFGSGLIDAIVEPGILQRLEMRMPYTPSVVRQAVVFTFCPSR